jgi:hypothetical protein
MATALRPATQQDVQRHAHFPGSRSFEPIWMTRRADKTGEEDEAKGVGERFPSERPLRPE